MGQFQVTYRICTEKGEQQASMTLPALNKHDAQLSLWYLLLQEKRAERTTVEVLDIAPIKPPKRQAAKEKQS